MYVSGIQRVFVMSVMAGCFSASVMADEPQVRHGVIKDQKPGVEVQAGATFTVQSSNDSRLKDEGLLSVDLTAEVSTGQGKLLTYVEGNLSPRQGGVSSLVEEVNGDAGSALDAQGKGRLQVSEIHYTRKFGENSLTIGILDPDCRLDTSKVANDETSQFLGNAFVNNPTIAFPDYTLGGCMHFENEASPMGLNLLITSSHGLGDNPNRSYSELFDVGADGKGVFAGVEWYRETAHGIWRLGLWRSTADFEYVDGSGRVDDNYGVYLNGDYIRNEYGINLRLGVANDEVSEAADFGSLAFEWRLENSTVGIALGHTAVSDKATGDVEDMSQSEVYYRFGISQRLEVTPSVQWVKNSDFDSSSSAVDENLTVYSLRVSMVFQ